MGRVGTHLTDLSAGWGPSGRRFKSGLPDSRSGLALDEMPLCSGRMPRGSVWPGGGSGDSLRAQR